MANTILILTNSIGGLFNFRRQVIKAIADKSYQVYISYPDIDDHRGDEYFNDAGCIRIPTVFDRRGVNPFADIKLLLTYLKIIKKIKPKAVLTYTIKPNVYGGISCRLLGVPQLANVTGLGDAVENGGFMKKLTLNLYKIGISKAYVTFFQNSSNRAFFIKEGIADDKSIQLPGSGVSLDFHQFQPYPEEGNVKFLYIGRIMKDKGSSELFEMAKYLKGKYPTAEFSILGSIEGDYQQQLDELIQAGVFKYHQHCLDVRPHLAKCHCTIMPSYHEGMSNVNLESAANGRPVITTDVPGCRETVDDGKSGFLVKAKDSKSLIEGAERFLALSYGQMKQMGLEARRKVEREFDRNIVVKAYLDAIESI